MKVIRLSNGKTKTVELSRGEYSINIIKKDGKDCVVLYQNGIKIKEGKKYDEVYNLLFSKDGKHFAYTVKNNGKYFVVIDDKELEKHNKNVYFPTFSFKNEYFAYITEEDGKEFVVLYQNGKKIKEGKKYDKVYNLLFSKDGKHFVYTVKNNGKFFVVIDNKELEKHNKNIYFSTFSFKNEYFAYMTEEDGKEFIVLYQNGKKIKEGKKYDEITQLKVSQDSTHIAYIAKENGKNFVVIDDKEGIKYDHVTFLHFIPNSKIISYKVIKDGKTATLKQNIE